MRFSTMVMKMVAMMMVMMIVTMMVMVVIPGSVQFLFSFSLSNHHLKLWGR